jgi:hypothetical protein
VGVQEYRHSVRKVFNSLSVGYIVFQFLYCRFEAPVDYSNIKWFTGHCLIKESSIRSVKTDV